MTHPAFPDEGSRLLTAARRSSGSVLFDFVEVFNPRIVQIRDLLAQIEGAPRFQDRPRLLRAIEGSGGCPEPAEPQGHGPDPVPGDRALPGDPALRPGPILAVRGSLSRWGDHLGLSAPYDPPNPEDYRYGVVDGKVAGEIRDGRHDDRDPHGFQAPARGPVEALQDRRDRRRPRFRHRGDLRRPGRAGPVQRQALPRRAAAPAGTRTSSFSPGAGTSIRRRDCARTPISPGSCSACRRRSGRAATKGARSGSGRSDDVQEVMQSYPRSLAKRTRYPAIRAARTG